MRWTRASWRQRRRLAAVAAHDLIQRRHAILRNFPVVGHVRYLLERIGPELRQYIVTGNDEERPFSRDQRRWVYASAKLENNYFGFGTDNDVEHTRRLRDHQAPHVRAARPRRRHRHAGEDACAAVREGARRGRAGGGTRSVPTRSSTSPG